MSVACAGAMRELVCLHTFCGNKFWLWYDSPLENGIQRKNEASTNEPTRIQQLLRYIQWQRGTCTASDFHMPQTINKLVSAKVTVSTELLLGTILLTDQVLLWLVTL